MNNGDMPAMPVTDDAGMPFNSVPEDLCTIGLTKREAFSKAAMQGLLAADSDGASIEGTYAEAIARDAVSFADALLNELERTKST